MNIFVLDNDPVEAAWMLDSKRTGKMLIESGQMLATALRERGATDEVLLRNGVVTSKGTPWRSTHRNHPCSVWARATYGNFMWLGRHAVGLAECFSHRRGKEHACEEPVRRMVRLARHFFPAECGMRYDPRTYDHTMTPFVMAMPVEVQEAAGFDPVEAYRLYFHTKENVVWSHDVPDWWNSPEYLLKVESLRTAAEMAEVN